MEQQKNRLVVRVDISVEQPGAYGSDVLAQAKVHREALAAGEEKGTIADSGGILEDLIQEAVREGHRQVEILTDEQVRVLRQERAKKEREKAELEAGIG